MCADERQEECPLTGGVWKGKRDQDEGGDPDLESRRQHRRSTCRGRAREEVGVGWTTRTSRWLARRAGGAGGELGGPCRGIGPDGISAPADGDDAVVPRRATPRGR